MSTHPIVVGVAEDTAALAAFARVRARAQPGVGPEPVPPDATRLFAKVAGEVSACCTTMVVENLHGAPGYSGLVGHYEALDGAAGQVVLRAACERLTHAGVERVLGPMNGSTWVRYRLALPPEPGEPEAPWFLGEPRNPPEYAGHFEAAGFTVAARYESRIEEPLTDQATVTPEAEARATGHGVRLRTLDLDHFDRELRAMFELSLEGFADNLYYTPIDAAAFVAQYTRMRSLIDRELVLLAEEASGRLLGFLFAYGDPVPAARPTRLVVKTVATAPSARGMGLGSLLLDRVERRAHELGYQSAIHALMHVDNFSMKMSARHQSRVLRRYALYEWTP